jgi:hypothetical protein
MAEELDYENDMAIDPDQLDIAALEQSNLAMKYSTAAADFDRAAKHAAERVKVLRSQLVRDVTSDPEGCLGKGLKATGAVIEAYYRNDEGYKEAKDAVIEAEYQRDLAKAGAVNISYQRKKMIEILAQLLQAQYFCGPSVPRDLSEEWKSKKEASTQAVTTRVRPQRKRS